MNKQRIMHVTEAEVEFATEIADLEPGIHGRRVNLSSRRSFSDLAEA